MPTTRCEGKALLIVELSDPAVVVDNLIGLVEAITNRNSAATYRIQRVGAGATDFPGQA